MIDTVFLKFQKMEQINNAAGYPTALLIERLFWLGLGGFLGVTIITSVIRGLKDRRNKIKPLSSEELKNLAKKTIQHNSDIN